MLRNSESQVKVQTPEQQIAEAPHQEDDHSERIFTVEKNSKKHSLLSSEKQLTTCAICLEDLQDGEETKLDKCTQT